MNSSNDAGSRGAFGDMANLVKHLPNYHEPRTLILLRGHLLVEEQLRGYVDRKLTNPRKFKHKWFSFAKILMLCSALTSPSVKSWAFDAADKLNGARNEIAHELESTKLDSKIEIFVGAVEQHANNSVFPPKGRGEARLYMAVVDLYDELIRVLHAD